MTTNEVRKKEPLIHITKRGQLVWYRAWGIRIGAVLLALIVSALISVIMTGKNPFEIYATIFQGTFGTTRKLWIALQDSALLLCISLAVTPAFRMKFWNVGGEGQALIGCFASAACMILLKDVLPHWAVIVCMVLASLLAGAVWGFIPAFFKAKWNTNETLFTLMMNYVATQIVAFFCVIWESPKGSGQIGVINLNTGIGWLPDLFGNKYLLCISVVLLLCAFMYFYLSNSKHGYEISVVGESEKTAHYVGIKVEKVIIRTMCLSGALCGLAGLLLTGGVNHTLTTTLVSGRGFTAVMVSWMAKFNPIFMILTSFLIVFLSRGASDVASKMSLNTSFSDILTGIILFFIIGSEFFITYKVHFRKKHTGEEIAHV